MPVIMLFLLFFCGCDSSQTSTVQSNNMGIPDCPFCGEWETPKRPDRISLTLSISPDKFELKRSQFSGPDRKFIFQGWDTAGGRKGVIRFHQNDRKEGDNHAPQRIEINEMEYILGNYSLILIFPPTTEVLFIRSGVKIPEQPNPLLGKWGFVDPNDKPGDFKKKWNSLHYSIWFKKNSIKSSNYTSNIKDYIIEDGRVIILHKDGSWGGVEIMDKKTILSRPEAIYGGLVNRYMIKDEENKYIRIE